MKIYLAHHGTPEIKERAKKLQLILEKNGYEVYNPFDHNGRAKQLTETWDKYFELRTKKLSEDIVMEDESTIDKCDVFVAFIAKPSIGTSMEIVHAYYNITQPIFILTNYDSPWLMGRGKIVRTTEELLEELKRRK